jgi:hypothetical protein
MSASEAFNFAKALNQIGMGAQQALADPVVGQVVRTALPIAAGAAGTAIGGPAGTAIGAGLGNAAVSALPGAPAARPPAPPAAPPAPPPAPPAAPAVRAAPAVAGGSTAAAQGLVLSQQPDVLKALLAVAMGQHGQKSVGGVPVAQILAMLSSVLGQAAADADELMYLDQQHADDGEAVFDGPDDRALYTTLLDADSAELADALGAS